jgi:hypothetical protein
MLLKLFRHAAGAGVGVVRVHDERKRVHHVAVKQNIQLHKLGGAVVVHLVVKACVALCAGFQRVEEVVDDLAQGQVVVELHPVGVDIFCVLINTAALLAKLHHRADIGGRRKDAGLHKGLGCALDDRGVRIICGVVDGDLASAGQREAVDNRGQRGDDVQIVFALQPLLNNFHVQKAQKTAAEAEAKRHRRLRLEGEGRVVELELFQRVAQVGIL